MSNYPDPQWHWPRFPPRLCGSMNDRERLGLPDHYYAGALEPQLAAARLALYGTTQPQLLAMVENPACSLAERIVSGNLLALLGDSRIITTQPAMCDIPGGRVEIGLARADVDRVLEQFDGLGLDRDWIEKECPRHSVSLAPFRMARYPVTNGEYRDFLLDSGYGEIPGSWDFRRYPQERANHPVYTVSPAAADAYAAWLAARTGRAFRLPTEAEWEWAAGGGDGREFPWTGPFDAWLANTAESGLFCTTPVGVFAGGASPFGLADMAGNVEEYVSDHYRPYPDGDFVRDDLVEIHGDYRVARGGSFARFRDLARVRRRHGHNPRSVTYAMGFRLAETL